MSLWLAIAMALDAAFGEPDEIWSRAPHPAVLMGRAVGWFDRTLNIGGTARGRGILACAALVFAAFSLGEALAALPGPFAEILVAAILLAQRSLVDHVRAVARGLRHSLAEGRRAVSMIVGRDTGEMDEPAIARAAIESAAENLSDGVTAPAFWFLIGGLPGLLVYKIVNTADSMIGYRTPRHEGFGWASAKLDDAMNWIPARLTALLIWLVAGRPAPWREIAAEARLHRSPNAGWPEAAMARALGVALSGPRAYHGRMQDFPWVNPQGFRDIGPAAIEAACAMLWKAWAAGFCVVIVLAWT
ncbi:Adenosylcobinamide-phosphate synthase [Limimaricola hongkongensis DSM 17492]|uniref:Cobalamin biosynthesis protein CobD n=2 Tax=Limimaricola hongkongensis TaxID=278132 RepID=A0A017HGE0_9RHOB|nr:Adenosylcobinamide-phosphate synthase [Limimaricola hongkongensis DSM 17492]